MPRITLGQVEQARKKGPILTDAEIEEEKHIQKDLTYYMEEPVELETILKKKAKKTTKKKAKKTDDDSVDVFKDTHELNQKFFGDLDFPRDCERLKFEISRWKEEMNETIDAINKGDADGVVDGAIDLITFIVGTLDTFGVDGAEAWRRVHAANMAKRRGTKSTRPDSKGVDLIKPKGWVAPSHKDNLGMLEEALDFSK